MLDATVLGRYFVSAGALRFGIEFLRVNERVAFGLSVAHLVSTAAIALGAIVHRNRSPDAACCFLGLTAFLMRRFYLIPAKCTCSSACALAHWSGLFGERVLLGPWLCATASFQFRPILHGSVNNVVVPAGLAGMQGRARVDALRR